MYVAIIFRSDEFTAIYAVEAQKKSCSFRCEVMVKIVRSKWKIFDLILVRAIKT